MDKDNQKLVHNDRSTLPLLHAFQCYLSSIQKDAHKDDDFADYFAILAKFGLMRTVSTALALQLPLAFSSAGLDLLKRFEGFRRQAYLDFAGLLTIGYGHRLLAGESFPAGIDEQQAAELLTADVQGAESDVRRLVKVPLTQGQFDALVDFVFNLGAGRLAASTLLRDLNSGRYEEAGEQILRWDHSGAEELAGLKARRAAEHELWQQPDRGEQPAVSLPTRAAV